MLIICVAEAEIVRYSACEFQKVKILMRDFLLRPICDATGGSDGALLAGGPVCFKRVETLGYDRASRRLPLKSLSPDALSDFTKPRADVLGLSMGFPRIMGVLNITPDSFSDGRADESVDAAVARGLQLIEGGADFLDIGGESTRPGAAPVSITEEQDRVLPVIEGLVTVGVKSPISVDTRNAATARAAFQAGARLFNDVSALSHDPDSLAFAAETGATVCLMHASGDPRTMQDDPTYRNVLIDIFAYLEGRLAACLEAGIAREKIIIDPGIGFGKTVQHNVTILSGLSAFQGLGVPVLIGASRKGFIGKLSGEGIAAKRAPGSIAAALVAAGQGAQIIRAHDVAETRQALTVWTAASGLWDI